VRSQKYANDELSVIWPRIHPIWNDYQFISPLNQ